MNRIESLPVTLVQPSNTRKAKGTKGKVFGDAAQAPCNKETQVGSSAAASAAVAATAAQDAATAAAVIGLVAATAAALDAGDEPGAMHLAISGSVQYWTIPTWCAPSGPHGSCGQLLLGQ